jgi:sugar phosphate isomerase/epimerase
MQHLNRRRFLGAAVGTGAAAATAGAWVPSAGAQGRVAGHNRQVPNNRIGIQLYTMRDQITEGNRQSVRRVLNFLGANGYTEVETAGYYGFTAAQMRSWLDAAGLRAVSGHDGVNIDPDNTSAWKSDYQTTLDNANTLGQKYTGLAWFGGPYDDADYWHFLAERFNEAGALAKAAGLQFFYHNHDFEFLNRQESGAPYYDILLKETDPGLVKFELDLYWIIAGGESPLEYLSADPSRYFAYHVKDRTWKPRPDVLNPDGSVKDVVQEFEDVGPGAIDFPDIFAAGLGRPRTDKHYFVEHDLPALSHPGDPQAEYKTALAGVTYLRNVRF